MKDIIIKRLLIIISLILGIFAIYKIMQTYGVFYSEATATVTQNQANWIISLNGTNISSGIVQQFVINQIQIQPNTHVATGKLAPNVTGDFYITIDPSDTDVSVRYDIQLNQENLTNEKIQIVSIEEVLQNNTLIQTTADTYTGIMSLANINADQINKIKIRVTWENDELNNQQDTQIGTVLNAKINIPISVNVSQYLGEAIVAYVVE